jgi:N-acetylglucosamine kinase-like BadF-type ATPase
MRRVIGIDAGGSKTVALLADEEGRVLEEARAGGANLHVQGELEVEKVLHGLMDGLSARGVPTAVCLGMAGVDRPEDRSVVHLLLRRLGHRERVLVVNDAVIALAAGSPDRAGVVVLAGTGSIAYGADRHGRTARAGGYGSLLSDEGSGYWLGREALRAVVRGHDGRGPRTRLAGLVLAALEVDTVAALVPRVYDRELSRREVAALAPFVQQAVDEGDEVARAMLEQAGRELGLAARAAAQTLDFDGLPFPVVLAGGVFRACPDLVDHVGGSLRLDHARPSLLRDEPARGAVLLALDLLG